MTTCLILNFIGIDYQVYCRHAMANLNFFEKFDK